MTREEAIKICTREKECVQSALDACADGGHYVSPDGIITAVDYVEAMTMAIAALREQEERSKGCEYCDGSGKNFLVDDDIPFGSYNSIRLYDGKAFLDDADGFEIRIKFCPMCGRRLEEV